MASTQFLAIFFAALLAFGTNTSQASRDHHPDDHGRGNYFEDRFLARAFGFRRSIKQQEDPKIVRVDDFGAKGNGTDCTEAFGRAWDEACSSEGSVRLVVPRNTYLLKPITFKGPCKSDQVRVQIFGIVRASTEILDYGDDNPRDWIMFDGVQNLTVEGVAGGTIDGWGGVWWNRPCELNNSQPCPRAPTAMKFNKCENLVARNMRSVYAQGRHISIEGCTNVSVSGLTATASANTAGIIVRETTNLTISDSVVATGADCIALSHATSNVRVSGFTCGPGHGISMGNVSDVSVDGAVFSGTTGGLTIKTWPGGSGNVKRIKFMNIAMANVQNPILIDQDQNSAVQVEDVLYQNITGTSASPVAVNFNCNGRFKCREIVLRDVDLRANDDNTVRASCKNVDFTTIGAVAPLCPDDVTRSTPSQPPVDHRSISVDDFGAKGNGKDDDSDAFERAWQHVCSSNEETFLVVPKKTYLLRPVRFVGQCKSKITIQILGTLEASKDRSHYSYRSWILFERVNDLTIEGGGAMDGNGQVWWRNSCKWNKSMPCSDSPAGLMFHGCQNLEVRNLTVQNSPQMQVIIGSCEDVKVDNVSVSAPGNSPNTDGIHITHSHNVNVSNAIIATGDDCISIVSGSRRISASDIRCGPGHGISIGSLGHGNSEAHVSDVTVTRARFFGSTNGVRIKTWQGGSGNVSKIIFRDIEMHNVRNPIIIDQNYCIDKHGCKDQESAVEVKDVLYENIKGTIDRGVGVMLDCSERHKCEGIVLQDIDLRTHQTHRSRATAVCNNVHFTTLGNVSPTCPN